MFLCPIDVPFCHGSEFFWTFGSAAPAPFCALLGLCAAFKTSETSGAVKDRLIIDQYNINIRIYKYIFIYYINMFLYFIEFPWIQLYGPLELGTCHWLAQ